MANVLFKMAGHRKATQSFCNYCQMWHNTRRSVGGSNECTPVFHETMDFPAIVGLTPRGQDVSR